jgi:hypothetical protein
MPDGPCCGAKPVKQATVGFLAGVLALSATPAVSLECSYGTVQQDYWAHKDSAEAFILVYGAFSDFKLVESVEADYTGTTVRAGYKVFVARFDGFRASRRTFDQAFSTEATLNFPDESYIGGFDTSLEAETLPGKVGLVWLLQTDTGYEVTAGGCSQVIDTEPSNVKLILRCLRGGYCPK